MHNSSSCVIGLLTSECSGSILNGPSFWNNKLGSLQKGHMRMKHGIWLLSHNLNNFIKSHQVATWKILSVSRKMKLFGRQESDGSTPVKCFTVEKMTIPLNLQNLLSCMYLQQRVVTVCLGESRRASAEGCAHRKGTEKRKERLSWGFVFVVPDCWESFFLLFWRLMGFCFCFYIIFFLHCLSFHLLLYP